MLLMHTTTVGVFTDKEQAGRTIAELQDAGVDEKFISFIATRYEGQTVIADAGGDEASGAAAGKGAASGAATGAIIGTIAGLAVANGILPGIGTLFVAGPLATALGLTGAAATAAAGAMTGAAAGGLLGALAGIGITDPEEAKLYERRVQEGGYLVAATGEGDLKPIFERNGAEEIRQYQ